MYYSKNLLKLRKKSKFAVIFGIISCILAVSIILAKSRNHEGISAFYWIYSIFFLLIGISNIFAGRGYSVDKLFGKAFIEINSNTIELKTGIFNKLQMVDWNAIHSIDYSLNSFVITKNDNSTVKLTLNHLEYSVIQEIKEAAIQIATEKKININLG